MAGRHAERPPAPQARGRAAAVEARAEADHARVANLLMRRQTIIEMLTETEAELRRRGVEVDAIRAPLGLTPQADHRVSASEAARIMRVTKKTIHRWAAASGCGWVSTTGRMMVDLPALQEWRASPR
ncbi:hypothetical protein [Methylobacterium radiodurans]|uniref:Helix-turn-helix domain-containing protein n=1 Tax=Methylobacterium radiodurans TaxID=2202828 RepID=A0A2U8VS78_9HYPH|nr:hypothetical protein [Methylobacterium radiodurans]AWN36525.1 hypothetical protein DK427_12955 [Methylobacterium radiodurans]